MPHVRLLPILILGLIGFCADAACAAAVTIHPVKIELSAARRSELIELKNSGRESARFQAQGHAWHESADGKMTLAPTKDLLFFPSLLEIPPGETRRIRIASTVRPGPVERSYRLILDEFPKSAAPGTVQVLTRLSIPVFVQPSRPTPSTSVKAEVEQGQLAVWVANSGNSHIKTQSVRVVARSLAGEVVFEQSLTGWYVLARGRRRYDLDLPGGVCMQIATLNATVRSEQGDASSVSKIEPGAGCGS